jgi:rare lipoprotein A (peptidoglycan hydrolase)
MAAQAAAAIARPRALSPSPEHIVTPRPFRWLASALAMLRRAHALRAVVLVGGISACATATLALVPYQRHQQDNVASASIRNETIVVRQKQQAYRQAGQPESFDEREQRPLLSNFPRAVQTFRFLNPGLWRNSGSQDERAAQGKRSGLNGQTATSAEAAKYRGEGVASWYGPDFHGRRTANGERYDMNGISAAHRSMPLPSYARITNLENGRSMIVRVNNRGPFVHNRVADLSIGAAKALEFYKKGTARVRVEFVGRASKEASDDEMLLATLRAGAPAPVQPILAAESGAPSSPKATDANEAPVAGNSTGRPSRRASSS